MVFDYPARQMTLAEPGIRKPRGARSPATANPANGIIQIEAIIDGEKYSFALDNGASFSCVPDELLTRIAQRHPEWPTSRGAVGCAYIWGWWPREGSRPMMRIRGIHGGR